MTKSIRNILISLLLALATFVCAITIFAPKFTASADYTTTDGSHSFQTGAALERGSLGKGEFVLGFRLYQNSADHGNFYKFPNSAYHKEKDWWGGQLLNEFAYRFSVVKMLGNEEQVLANYYFIFETTSKAYMGLAVVVDKVSYYAEEINFLSSVVDYYKGNKLFASNKTFGERSIEYYGLKNADSIKYYTINNYDEGLMPGGYNIMDVRVGVNSPNQEYKVKFDFRYSLCSFSGIFATKYENIVSGSCESDKRSVRGVLEAANAAVGLEEFFTTEETGFDEASYNKAVEILNLNEKANVFVNYLEPIKGTPFAKKIREAISVPVAKDENGKLLVVYLDDVLSALGKDSISIFGAGIKKISRPTEDSVDFQVDYYRQFWMRAITTDGNYVDSFSDINKSFKTYYHSFVENGVITEDVYEYMYNSLLTKYKTELAPYQDKPQDVYGLWGMAILPETYTINSLWKDCFRTETTKGEQVAMFTYRSNMKYNEYEALTKTYEYSWIERAWQAVSGFVAGSTYPADYYLFYAKPGTTAAWLDYTGDVKNEEDLKDNPDKDGIIGGIIGDVGENVGDIVEGGKDVVNNFLGTIKDGGMFMTSGYFLFPALGVVLIGAIVFIIIKNTKKKRR